MNRRPFANLLGVALVDVLVFVGHLRRGPERLIGNGRNVKLIVKAIVVN